MISKTNAMRMLDSQGVSYQVHDYTLSKAVSAVEVAATLGQDVERVFKTLVTVGKSREHYVFVIPAENELDLKKAANASGEKFIEMIPQKELLPLTGYIHGGCSPIGMKKKFDTFVDETAILFDTIFISGGKVGYQIEINPMDLHSVVDCKFIDLTVSR